MKATLGFLFFMLFLAGFALVSLQSKQRVETATTTGDSDLTRPEWRAVRLFGISVPNDIDMSIEFGGEGRLRGSAGCNRYSGRFEQQAAQFRIASMRATRRSCADRVMSLEESLFEVFRNARKVSVADQELKMFDVDGDWLATFRANGESGRLATGS